MKRRPLKLVLRLVGITSIAIGSLLVGAFAIMIHGTIAATGTFGRVLATNVPATELLDHAPGAGFYLQPGDHVIEYDDNWAKGFATEGVTQFRITVSPERFAALLAEHSDLKPFTAPRQFDYLGTVTTDGLVHTTPNDSGGAEQDIFIPATRQWYHYDALW